jgi:hypothetical protein
MSPIGKVSNSPAGAFPHPTSRNSQSVWASRLQPPGVLSRWPKGHLSRSAYRFVALAPIAADCRHSKDRPRDDDLGTRSRSWAAIGLQMRRTTPCESSKRGLLRGFLGIRLKIPGVQPFLAEREGFEPSVPHKGTTVFETAPIDRSGTSPGQRRGAVIGAGLPTRNRTLAPPTRTRRTRTPGPPRN